MSIDVQVDAKGSGTGKILGQDITGEVTVGATGKFTVNDLLKVLEAYGSSSQGQGSQSGLTTSQQELRASLQASGSLQTPFGPLNLDAVANIVKGPVSGAVGSVAKDPQANVSIKAELPGMRALFGTLHQIGEVTNCAPLLKLGQGGMGVAKVLEGVAATGAALKAGATLTALQGPVGLVFSGLGAVISAFKKKKTADPNAAVMAALQSLGAQIAQLQGFVERGFHEVKTLQKDMYMAMLQGFRSTVLLVDDRFHDLSAQMVPRLDALEQNLRKLTAHAARTSLQERVADFKTDFEALENKLESGHTGTTLQEFERSVCEVAETLCAWPSAKAQVSNGGQLVHLGTEGLEAAVELPGTVSLGLVAACLEKYMPEKFSGRNFSQDLPNADFWLRTSDAFFSTALDLKTTVLDPKHVYAKKLIAKGELITEFLNELRESAVFVKLLEHFKAKLLEAVTAARKESRRLQEKCLDRVNLPHLVDSLGSLLCPDSVDDLAGRLEASELGKAGTPISVKVEDTTFEVDIKKGGNSFKENFRVPEPALKHFRDSQKLSGVHRLAAVTRFKSCRFGVKATGNDDLAHVQQIGDSSQVHPRKVNLEFYLYLVWKEKNDTICMGPLDSVKLQKQEGSSARSQVFTGMKNAGHHHSAWCAPHHTNNATYNAKSYDQFFANVTTVIPAEPKPTETEKKVFSEFPTALGTHIKDLRAAIRAEVMTSKEVKNSHTEALDVIQCLRLALRAAGPLELTGTPKGSETLKGAAFLLKIAAPTILEELLEMDTAAAESHLASLTAVHLEDPLPPCLIATAVEITLGTLAQLVQVRIDAEDPGMDWNDTETLRKLGVEPQYIIPRFRWVRGGLIGQSNFKVYAGKLRLTSILDETPVAIKEFPSAVMGMPQESLASACRELVTACSLSSPNVVRMFGACRFREPTESGLAILMELCGGGSLDGFIQRSKNASKTFTRAQKLGMGVQVLRGVRAVHQAKLVHCDIKPHNFLLQGDSEEDDPSCLIIKLSDFGVTRYSTTARSTVQTARGGAQRDVGTLVWMDPGADCNSRKTDMYSVALVLLWLFAYPESIFVDQFTDYKEEGKLPESDVIAKKMRSNYRPMRFRPGQAGGVDQDVWDLICGCWDEDTDRRMTAEQACAALERLL